MYYSIKHGNLYLQKVGSLSKSAPSQNGSIKSDSCSILYFMKLNKRIGSQEKLMVDLGHTTPKYDTWHLECFKLKGFEKSKSRKVTLTSFLPSFLF